MGGEGSWDNVDNTEAQCPVEDCDGDRAYFYMVQIRSADEPMTTFYKVSSLFFSMLGWMDGKREDGREKWREKVCADWELV